jgi:hypothetical protein
MLSLLALHVITKKNGAADWLRNAGESFGRLFPVTEGVGEIVEEQDPRLASGHDAGFPFLVPAAASSRRDREACTTVPPTPPVVHLSRPRCGRSSIYPKRWPARVTRPSTHAMPKIDCGVDYFFFRRFVVFFFAAAFFLFFAIAALLALSGWRYRYSAVANRSALHPDYYSRKKITVTPLEFVRKRAVPPRHVARTAHIR